jgi:hypothetical protein
LLATGHVDRGLDVLRSVMKALGLWLPQSATTAAAGLVPLRARIRLRGLGFTPRAEADVPREALVRIDALRGASLGLQMTHPLISVQLAAQHLLAALDAGVPERVLPALSVESVYCAFSGGHGGRARTREVLGRVERLAGEIGDPGARGWYLLARAFSALMEGRWREAEEQLEELTALQHGTSGSDKEWPDLSVDTPQMLRMNAAWQRGRVAVLRGELPSLIQDLKRRGNRLGYMWLSAFQSFVLCMDGQPAEGKALLARTMKEWSVAGFDMQSWWEVMAGVFFDLYEQKGEDAWDRMQKVWPKLERGFLLSDQLHRVEARVLLCRAALACAKADPSRRRELLARTEKECERIDREKAPWGIVLVVTFRAAVASLRGDRGKAEMLLGDAIPLLAAHDFEAVAAAAERARGLLLGGREGQAAVERSNGWMEAQSIADPEAFAAMYLPGQWV